MRRLMTACIVCMLCNLHLQAQKETDYRADRIYKDWVKLAPTFDDDFLHSEEAIRNVREVEKTKPLKAI